jgi:hypothetical protein
MRFSRKRSIKVIFRLYDCPPKCHMPQKVSQRGVPDILHISNILPAVESQSPCCYAPAACRLCFCSSMESGATPPPAKRLRGPPVDYTEDSNLAPVQEDAPLSPRTTGREITTMVAAPVTTMVAVPVQEPVQASAETVAPDRARLPVDTFAGRNDPCFLYLEQLPPQHHLVAGASLSGKVPFIRVVFNKSALIARVQVNRLVRPHWPLAHIHIQGTQIQL